MTYSIALEENEGGSISVGSNVPLQVAGGSGAVSAPRMDVGVHIRLSFRTRGAGVVVRGSVEYSAPDTAGPGGVVPIRHVSLEGSVPLVPGTHGVLATAFDVVSGRRYEVTITATRLGT